MMSDDFWLIEVMAQELSARMTLAYMADYHSWRRHRDARWCRVVRRWGAKHRDSCSLCHGRRGGVPGNENVIGGKIVCDYCHAEMLLRDK